MRLTSDQVDNLVTRLTKTNTTTAQKAVLWSVPRSEYEYQFKTTAHLKTRDCYWDRYTRISKHYPGSWRAESTQQVDAIVQRLSTPTYAHLRRADDNITRRRLIEEHRTRMTRLDIGTPRDRRETIDSARVACSAPQSPLSSRRALNDVTCERRRMRAARAPFPEWRDAESYLTTVKHL